MSDRLTSAIRRAATAVSSFAAGAFDAVLRWIHSGDVSAMMILGVIAVIMLLVVVVPPGRRY